MRWRCDVNSIVRLAGMLPRDPQFREFLGYFMVPPREISVDEAAEFIRIACGIDSRRELAENGRAADAFHTNIRKPFVAWRERQAEHA
ncbi:hypothetical protein BYI23_B004640 [Burkholderia sp. YI23]|nr:hypothetical protein BYI23_B004640 [Burkholderia sp. YI23]